MAMYKNTKAKILLILVGYEPSKHNHICYCIYHNLKMYIIFIYIYNYINYLKFEANSVIAIGKELAIVHRIG